MGRNIAAISSNLQTLVQDAAGESVPVCDSLRELARLDLFEASFNASTPISRLALRLQATMGGTERTDPHHEALVDLSEVIPPSDVWNLLIQMDAAHSFGTSTRTWVCLRDGLLPCDRSLLPFLAEGSNELVSSALDYGVDLGHRHDVKDPIRTDDLYPLFKRLGISWASRTQRLTSWSDWRNVNHRGPAQSNPDHVLSFQLLDLMLEDLTTDLAALTPYSPEWVKEVNQLLDNLYPVLTESQVKYLGDKGTFEADLLVFRFGPYPGTEGLPAIGRKWELPFAVNSWDEERPPAAFIEWLFTLIKDGSPAVQAITPDQVALVFRHHAVPIMSLTPQAHEILLRKSLRLREEWLVSKATLDEARELLVEELFSPGNLLPLTGRLSKDILPILAEMPGMPAYIAGRLEHREGTYDLDIIRVVNFFDGYLDRLGFKVTKEDRSQVMARLLSADSSGNGPFDGKATFNSGATVLLARRNEERARKGK